MAFSAAEYAPGAAFDAAFDAALDAAFAVFAAALAIPPPFSARTAFKKNAVQQLLQLHLDENRKLLIQPPQSQS